MDNTTAITQIQSMIGQAQNTVDSLTIALGLLQTGYQSDQSVLDAAATITAASTAIATANNALSSLHKQTSVSEKILPQ